MVTPSTTKEPHGRDDDASAGQRSADDPLHQSWFEAHQLSPQLGAGDVLALVGGLAHGGSDGVGVLRVDAGVGQRASDGVRVQHGVLQSAQSSA